MKPYGRHRAVERSQESRVMTAPLEMRPEAAPEAGLEGADGAAIEGRSLGRIAWMPPRRDKAAMTGGLIVLTLISVADTRPSSNRPPCRHRAPPFTPTLSRPYL